MILHDFGAAYLNVNFCVVNVDSTVVTLLKGIANIHNSKLTYFFFSHLWVVFHTLALVNASF